MGATAGAATAAIVETEPRRDTKKAAFFVSAANAAGAALGPLFRGVIGQYGPWPTRLPYVVYLLLMIPLLWIGAIEETVVARRRVSLVLRLPKAHEQ